MFLINVSLKTSAMTTKQFKTGDWVIYYNNHLGGEEQRVIQKIHNKHFTIHFGLMTGTKRVLKSNCY